MKTKKDYMGSDVRLPRKSLDEYIAYLEHMCLEYFDCYRCCECDRMIHDPDSVRFEGGEFTCPDCSEIHTRRLEREAEHFAAIENDIKQILNSRENAHEINNVIKAFSK